MADSITQPSGPRHFWDSRFLLIVFLRVIAVVFFVSGLQRWAIIMGPLAPEGNFFNLSPEWMAVTGCFAVLDLVAATGLWLLSSWGTVVWLIAALAETVLHTVFQQTFGDKIELIIFHGISGSFYIILSYFHARYKK